MTENKTKKINNKEYKQQYYNHLYNTNEEFREKTKAKNRDRYIPKTIRCSICYMRYIRDIYGLGQEYNNTNWICDICSETSKNDIPKKNKKNKAIHVTADEIDNCQFSYMCPYACNRKYHVHGSCGESHNRKESRCTHCVENNTDVEIYITDSTKRVNQLTPTKKKIKKLEKNIM